MAQWLNDQPREWITPGMSNFPLRMLAATVTGSEVSVALGSQTHMSVSSSDLELPLHVGRTLSIVL